MTLVCVCCKLQGVAKCLFSLEKNSKPSSLERGKSSFLQKLENLWSKGNFLCVGLDSDFSKIPSHLKDTSKQISDIIFDFNKAIIDATSPFACSFKIQIAYYEEHGLEGWKAMEKTVIFIKESYPDIPIILDAKRADIGSTNSSYAKAYFDFLGVDGLTVHPYLGKEALQPLLDYKDKGIIVLTRTSNPGAGEFQDLEVSGKPLYQVVAKSVAENWNTNGNCCIVVGATYPKELEVVRKIVGDMPILIPGIGAQGGDVKATVKAGKDSRGLGMIINSSRGIIFASAGQDFAQAAGQEAKKLKEEINKFRV